MALWIAGMSTFMLLDGRNGLSCAILSCIHMQCSSCFESRSYEAQIRPIAHLMEGADLYLKLLENLDERRAEEAGDQ